MEARTIRFIRRGELVSLGNVPPSRTLLEVLREDLNACGTKEGCGEGDCGACTVVLAEATDTGVSWRAVNSCIRLAHSIDGLALWTVEDLVAADGRLHPAQEAMVQCHGSQCGFCTPGFVMSLFGMYQKYIAPKLVTPCTSLPPEGALAPRDGPSALDVTSCQPITRALAREELSGNLCRCTGYRPILDAAEQMAQRPAVAIDEADLRECLMAIAPPPDDAPETAYLAPRRLAALLALRAARPQAQLVAGCTDAGLWVTKGHRQFAQVLDTTRVAELRRIEQGSGRLRIGAAVSLAEGFAALVAQWPQLHTFASRFAGLPVRNAGTLGGNVANGSPIGDSMPLLIALGAQLVLASVRGERRVSVEDFYTGYRQTVLAADEVLAFVEVPLAPTQGFLRAYKVSKRFEDDISAVCLALNLAIEGGTVLHARIGAGGVAATPARARATEAWLQGRAWTQATAQEAGERLRAEFTPLSDLRASATYRRELLGNLVQRFWLESQGLQHINLDSLNAGEVVA